MSMMCMQSNDLPKKIAVVGAGAAGCMAAGVAKSYGADVTLFDGNASIGKKLLITGKGRCNVTNNCDTDSFLQNVRQNPRFLYTALAAFDTQDTIAFFEALGVPLKTERGNRVFPVSDSARDIVNAMQKHIADAVFLHEKVIKIKAEDDGSLLLITKEASRRFDAVILATGGRSYPLTGSDGSGYRIASALSHTVIPTTPSLVPMETVGELCPALQGLSLKNISFSIVERESSSILYTDFGEMMFTHFGITGPVVLSASAHLRGYDPAILDAVIDLKPALDEEALDRRLLSDFKKYQNRDYINALSDLLPQKMIASVASLSGIDPRKKVHAITREERMSLLRTLKSLRIPLKKLRPIEEAIVTAGGIEVKEISPKTMMSKKVKNLYFAGEIIDVDAYTGGFNLQIAFSTGYLAGMHAAIDA